MNKMSIILNGIIKENPTFVLLLGMCPTLGTTSSAENGMGMGLATTFVLICSNVAISLVKNFIPDKIRIPAFIVIIAAFVTILEMCMKAYVPALYASLGLFIPLIVVNCIVLGRAESFAAKHNAFDARRCRYRFGIYRSTDSFRCCTGVFRYRKNIQHYNFPRTIRSFILRPCSGSFYRAGISHSHC